MSRAIPLLPLWAFMACYRENFRNGVANKMAGVCFSRRQYGVRTICNTNMFRFVASITDGQGDSLSGG
jgi:hypothetical protein